MRETTVRGPAIDLSEFERRLRGPERNAGKRRRSAERTRPADAWRRCGGDRRPLRAVSWPNRAPPGRAFRGPARLLRRRAARGRGAAALSRSPLMRRRRSPPIPSEPDYHQAQPATPSRTPRPPMSRPIMAPRAAWSDDAQYLDYGQADDGYGEPEARGPRSWLRPWHAVVAHRASSPSPASAWPSGIAAASDARGKSRRSTRRRVR